MLDYEEFKHILEFKLEAESKAEVLKSLARSPGRFVGIFRSTTAKAKLSQYFSQSKEIKFGDAYELIIREYLSKAGWAPLPRRIPDANGEILDIDQLVTRGGEVIFIEQKIRDDHDSTKKEGQMENFRRKAMALQALYKNKFKGGFCYFIDDSSAKNKKFYEKKIAALNDELNLPFHVCYGGELFELMGEPDIWKDILKNQTRWKEEVPESTDLNLDNDPIRISVEIEQLGYSCLNKIFSNERLKNEILPRLFPTGDTLRLVADTYMQRGDKKSVNLAENIESYLDASYQFEVVTS